MPAQPNITLQVETVQPPAMMDILGDDFTGCARGLEQLKVDRVQFTFHSQLISCPYA